MLSDTKGILQWNIHKWEDKELAEITLEAIEREMSKSDLIGNKIGQAPWFASGATGAILFSMTKWTLAMYDETSRNALKGMNGNMTNTMMTLGTILYLTMVAKFSKEVRRFGSFEEAADNFNIPTEIERSIYDMGMTGSYDRIFNAINRSETLNNLTLTPSAMVGRATGRDPLLDPGQRGFEKGKVLEAMLGASSTRLKDLDRLVNSDPNFHTAAKITPFAQPLKNYLRSTFQTDLANEMFGDPTRSRNSRGRFKGLKSSLKSATRRKRKR